MAPRKVRAVGEMLKGLTVTEAEAQLLSMRRRAAKPLLKLLRSAVANAKATKHLGDEKLFIESLRVDGGPMLKRSLPRARGSASAIQKKMSHVTLVLAENPKLALPRFKIVVPKKVKLPPGEGKRAKKERTKPEKEIAIEPKKKPGFFKRMFSRKAGFAK